MSRVLLGLAVALGSSAMAADPPAIQQIRANYQAVNAQISAGKYRLQLAQQPECQEEGARWLDARGVVRRLDLSSYGDGAQISSTERFQYWFDAAGRLDFVLWHNETEVYDVHTDGKGQTVSAPIETRLIGESRFYFGDKGELLRALHRVPLNRADEAQLVKVIKRELAVPWAKRQRCTR